MRGAAFVFRQYGDDPRTVWGRVFAIASVLAPLSLGYCAGSLAVGHTRYSTTGSSVLGNTQPLIVVDGIPISNTTEGGTSGGVVPQSRLNDINPEDIETIDILRGPAASATYGTDAYSAAVERTLEVTRAFAAPADGGAE
mgnify:CR=1 FL=1